MKMGRDYMNTEEYMRKMMQQKARELTKYDIDKIFLAEINGKTILVYKVSDDKYKELNEKTIIYYTEYELTIYKKGKVKVLSEFKKIISKNELDVILLDKNGNQKESITEQEAMTLYRMIYRRNNLSNSQKAQINEISTRAADVITDLLGINVTCNRSSKYDLSERNIQESVFPALKVLKFKKALKEYIAASLLLEKNIYISKYKDGIDYKITRSLFNANMKLNEQMKRNLFSFSVDIDGNMTIDGKNLTSNQGFQKIITLK